MESKRSRPFRFGNVRDDCEDWVFKGPSVLVVAEEAVEYSCWSVRGGDEMMIVVSLLSVSGAITEAICGPDGNFLRELRRGDDEVSIIMGDISVGVSLAGSGLEGGQLERELRSEDRSMGELARELDEVVLVDLEREERRVVPGADSCSDARLSSCDAAGFSGAISSSITSTT